MKFKRKEHPHPVTDVFGFRQATGGGEGLIHRAELLAHRRVGLIQIEPSKHLAGNSFHRASSLHTQIGEHYLSHDGCPAILRVDVVPNL